MTAAMKRWRVLIRSGDIKLGAQPRNNALRLCVAQTMLVHMPEDTLTAAEAAQESGVNKRTIQYNLLRGLLKGRQISGKGIWLINRGDLEAWLAERESQLTQREKE